jgi:dCTP deaminase
MILSDHTIRECLEAGRIQIEPTSPECIQPSSVDLHLSREFLVFRNSRRPFIDVREPLQDLTDLIVVPDGESFILHPGEFVLGSTSEVVGIPVDLVGRLDGKSSLGRCGLMIHSTAGYVDPGFRGRLTLELSNVANLPIALYPGMRIAQISFAMMTTAADVPYGSAKLGSKYQGQMGPRASELHREFGRSAAAR